MVSYPAQNGNAAACRAEKCPSACADGALEAFGAGKGIISCAEKECCRLPGRKMPFSLRGGCSGGIWRRKRYQNLPGTGMQPLPGRKMPFSLRGRCSGGVWGRKRYQNLRGTGMQPPAGQKDVLQSARKVLRRHLGQEKVSKSAWNWNAAVCRAEKCPSACAEGAPEAFGAGKGIKICAERECSRLPGRKMPFSLRGRCSGGIWSRKGYQNLPGTGHPAEKC